MLYKKVNIASITYDLPPIILTSEEIEDRLQNVYHRLNLPNGRLELMSGIKERRLWPPNTPPSYGAILAGEKAIKSSGISKEKIGCLMMCSVCRDFLEPATATIIHHQLGLPDKALVFDISNACLGVLTGILMAANMIELGQIEAGLLVAGENSRALLETTINKMNNDLTLTRKSIKPYFASLTIGSGAVAIVVCKPELTASQHKLVGGTTLSATQYHNLCTGNFIEGSGANSDTIMNTDSEMLLHKGIEIAGKTWKNFQSEMAWSDENIDIYCTHQVGNKHRKMLFDTLKIDISKDFPTISKLGNVGSVSCPVTTAMAIEKKVIKKGDNVALLGIGSGITSTMLGIAW